MPIVLTCTTFCPIDQVLCLKEKQKGYHFQLAMSMIKLFCWKTCSLSPRAKRSTSSFALGYNTVCAAKNGHSNIFDI